MYDILVATVTNLNMAEEIVEESGSDNFGTKIKVIRGQKGGYGWEITLSCPLSVGAGSIEEQVAKIDQALTKRYLGGGEATDVTEME